MLKRVTSLLLCLLLVLTCCSLAACTGGSDDADNNGENGSENGGENGSNGGENGDSNGEDGEKEFQNEAKDFGDTTVKILGYKGEGNYYSCQIDVEKGSDDPVEDAFYKRNAFIEENYGINIDVVVPGTGEDPIEMIRQDVASNQKQYQAVVNAIHYIAPLAIDGYFQDFNSLESDYIHLENSWWDQTLIEDVKINDKIFFVTGDALVEDDEATWAIYFNKDLVEEYNLESPYDLVKDNNWTLDTMYEMVKKVSVQSGAEKSYDPAVGDVWGIVVQSYDFYLFMQGCEQPMIDNSGSTPVLRVDEEENVLTFNAITEFYYDPVNCGVADYHYPWTEAYPKERQIFANGNALFMPGSISYVGYQELREAEINYGILPMPKRDAELQENYSTGINAYHCAVICIPRNNKGDTLDATCYALEAMAYYGKELVTPEYYDRTLTLKRFEDTESGEMLDLIFRNRTYDLGSVFNFNAGDPYVGTLYFYTNILGEKSTELMSKYNTYKNVFQTGLDDLLEKCDALD